MTASAGVVVDFAGPSFEAAKQDPLLLASPDTPVAVAVPAWFTMADRRQLLTHLNPEGARQVGLVSSALAGAHSRHVSRSGPSLAPELVLDVRVGWSAGLIHCTADGLTEVAAWGIAPHDGGDVDDAIVCPWFIDQLFAASEAVPGTRSIHAVLVIDDVGERTELVRQAVKRCTHPLAGCSVNAGQGKDVMTGGVELVARPDGVRHTVGALTHALTVSRQLFELGPDDGVPLHFEIYEQHRSAPTESTIDHRLVVRANLVRERGYDQNMMVTFELGSNGLLSIGPRNAWSLDWQPGSLELEGSR